MLSRGHKLFPFFKICFSFCCCSDWMTSIILSSYHKAMFFCTTKVYCYFFLLYFHFSYCIQFWLFFSSLLKFSLFHLLFSQSRLSVLISYTLNSSVNYLPVSLVVFPRVLSCSFIWSKFFCLVILLTFLSLWNLVKQLPVQPCRGVWVGAPLVSTRCLW